jgi:stalled ribosome alternative rescue factor ArfA
MSSRNLVAKALANPIFRQKKKRSKKGKGSYSRKTDNSKRKTAENLSDSAVFL